MKKLKRLGCILLPLLLRPNGFKLEDTDRMLIRTRLERFQIRPRTMRVPITKPLESRRMTRNGIKTGNRETDQHQKLEILEVRVVRVCAILRHFPDFLKPTVQCLKRHEQGAIEVFG